MRLDYLINILNRSVQEICDVSEGYLEKEVTHETSCEISRSINDSLEETNRILADELGIEIRASLSSDCSSGSIIIDTEVRRSPFIYSSDRRTDVK